MNMNQAVKAMERGEAVEIYLTEQVCRIFEKEGFPFVRLVGPNAKQMALKGEYVKETTEMTLDHFKMLYRTREDIKIVKDEKPEPEDDGKD